MGLRFAVRGLLRHPGFSVLALVTLALGIGVSTAVFSIVQSLLLKPLSYPEPERIVTVWADNRRAGLPRDTSSLTNLGDLRNESGVFSAVASLFPLTWTYSDVEDPVALQGVLAGSEFFDAMGVMPIRGRRFQPADDKLGAEPVVMLSYALWRNTFHQDESILGKPIRLSHRPLRVIGVMPEGFQYPGSTAFWLNIPSGMRSPEPYQNRDWTMFQAVGRIRSGITMKQARERAVYFGDGLSQRFPKENRGTSMTVVPLLEHLMGDLPALLWMLLATVVSVLLIGCVNIAGLQLARASARRTEFAVRRALGAGRRHVVIQLLTESLLLAVTGGALGAALAALAIRVFAAADPLGLPRASEIALGWSALLFAGAMAVGSGVLFGLAPALEAAGVPLASVLRESAESSRRPLLRESMLAVQIALAFALACGAGFMARGFAQLQSKDLGLNKQGVLTFKLGLPTAVYGDPAKGVAFHRDLPAELSSLPGVSQVGIGNHLLQSNVITTMLRIEGGSSDAVEVSGDWVSTGYFQTLGIQLHEGRHFTPEDAIGNPAVAIVNESLAKRYWPGQSPVGKRVRLLDMDILETIVGVVADSRTVGPGVETKPMHYTPILQNPISVLQVMVRFDERRSSAEALGAAVRRTVHGLDKSLAVEQMEMLDRSYDRLVAPRRVSAWLLGMFSMFAILLAAIGIFGVQSYQVRLRRREIGIRIALGEDAGSIVWQVSRRAALALAVGLGIGIGAAAILSRLAASVIPLYSGGGALSPVDAANLVGAGLLLSVAVALAGVCPAWRAAKMHPMEALRSQ